MTLRQSARDLQHQIGEAMRLSGRRPGELQELFNQISEFCKSQHPLLDAGDPATCARGYAPATPPE